MRTSKEQRRVILAEFERSGLSATQFAQGSGLKYSTFAGWLSRYRRRKGPGLKSAVRRIRGRKEIEQKLTVIKQLSPYFLGCNVPLLFGGCATPHGAMDDEHGLSAHVQNSNAECRALTQTPAAI